MKTIYIPSENSEVLSLLPEYITNNLNVKTVSSFAEVYTDLFK